MAKKERKQWHPAFCSAVRLELVENKNDLEFRDEFKLNTSPISVDLLVITKSPDVIISNEIGKIFKGHNLMEYKSPQDALNIDIFFKGLAYTCLYKAYGAGVDSRRAEDITLSFVRKGKPRELFKQLEAMGMSVEEGTAGIYYLKSVFPFDIQVIVSKELNQPEHIWLTSLTENINRETAEQLLIDSSNLSAKDDRENASSVVQVAMQANRALFSQLKEDEKVCDALRELMKPELDEAVAEGISQGRLESIAMMLKNGGESLVKDMLGATDEEIAKAKEKLQVMA